MIFKAVVLWKTQCYPPKRSLVHVLHVSSPPPPMVEPLGDHQASFHEIELHSVSSVL